jgi:hypothetical protein
MAKEKIVKIYSSKFKGSTNNNTGKRKKGIIQDQRFLNRSSFS